VPALPAPAAPALAAAQPAKPQPVVSAKVAPAATAAANGDTGGGRARCKEIAASHRQKDLVSVCSEAFAAEPTAADVAVILAKAEFDRGHIASALSWGQKAVAANPNAADAYVFIGSAEQSAGHNKAAKEAYKRYLQLAPGGRYAGDLRAIVGTL
jgi:tetratricopeptide (TPR) repeat protein